MAHTPAHRYCPTCNTNLDYAIQVAEDMRAIAQIISGVRTGAYPVSATMHLGERYEEIVGATPAPAKKKKATAKQRKYKAAFKRLAPKYKKKNGSWKKDGFKRCVKAAHREVR